MPSFSLKGFKRDKTGNSLQPQNTGSSSSSLRRFSSFRSGNNNPFADHNRIPHPEPSSAPLIDFSDSQASTYGAPPRDEKSASGAGQDDYEDPPPEYQVAYKAPVPASSSSAPPEPASSSSAPPEPAPPSLMRAGTFNASAGTFRHLQELENMNKVQIREMFGRISGANLLQKVDTVFIIDNNGNMDRYRFRPLLESCLTALATIISAFDPDGYSVYVLNGGSETPDDYERGILGGGWNDLSTAVAVREILSDIHLTGTSPLDIVLDEVITYYLDRYEDKNLPRLRPLNLVVFTDGSVDDPDEVETLIESICARLDRLHAARNQIGIQLVQMGDIRMATQHIKDVFKYDPVRANERITAAEQDIENSTQWLERVDNFMGKLAENPKYKKRRDIVDTKGSRMITQGGTFNPVWLIEILGGALIKRFDNS